jgi:hypothetical protein
MLSYDRHPQTGPEGLGGHQKGTNFNPDFFVKIRDDILVVLEKYFNDYTREEASGVFIDDSCKEKFDQMRKAEIYFQYFSDSLIAFVPLEFRSYYSVTVNGVCGV